MNTERRKRLEAAGFKSTTVADFLGLTPEESAVVEARVAVAKLVRDKRKASNLTQSALGSAVGITQARVSRAEDANDSVSLDQLISVAIGAGADLKEIGLAIANAGE